MNPVARRFLGKLLIVTVGLAHGLSLATVQAQQDPYPNFPLGVANNNTGNGTWWTSGDAPYGIYYPSSLNCPVSLWTFRDTFLTPPDYAPAGRINPQSGYVYPPNPNISPIVGNTIAIAANSSTNFAPVYFYGANSSPSHPKSFFECPYPDTYKYWPNKAFFVGSSLYVTLSIINSNQNVGTDIARITNPTAVPSQWNIEHFNLTVSTNPNAPDAIWFGNEALTSFSAPTDSPVYNLVGYQGNYVLMYGYYVPPAGIGQVIAILIPNLALATTPNGGYLSQSPYQILRLANVGGSPQWLPGLIGPNGFDYYDINQNNPYGGLTGFAGYSVRYNSNAKAWQLVSVAGGNGIASYPNISATPGVWLGPSAIGPFSQFKPVTFTFPELPQNSYWNQNIPTAYGPTAWQQTQCYGIREWQLDPNQEHDSTLFFTYTVASTNVGINIQDLAMYENYSGGAPNPFFNSAGGFNAIRVGPKTARPKASQPLLPGAQQVLRLPAKQTLLPMTGAQTVLRIPANMSKPKSGSSGALHIPAEPAAAKLKGGRQ